MFEALQEIVRSGAGEQPLGEVHAQHGQPSELVEPRFRDVDSKRVLLENRDEGRKDPGQLRAERVELEERLHPVGIALVVRRRFEADGTEEGKRFGHRVQDQRDVAELQQFVKKT